MVEEAKSSMVSEDGGVRKGREAPKAPHAARMSLGMSTGICVRISLSVVLAAACAAWEPASAWAQEQQKQDPQKQDPQEDEPGAAPEALVDEFLASQEASPAAVRTFLGKLEPAVATAVPRTADRPPRLASLRGRLLDGLHKKLGGDAARAGALLSQAEKERREYRRGSLEGRLLCWCPDEGWTRTLTGCPDGCAEEQKSLVRDWMAQGLTDDEILARMEAHPRGGPKVLAVPPAEGFNLIGYAAPLLIAVPSVLLVAWFLLRVLRAGRGGAGPEPPADVERDSALTARIEQELKEMDA